MSQGGWFDCSVACNSLFQRPDGKSVHFDEFRKIIPTCPAVLRVKWRDMTPILTITLSSELDVIASRQRARQVAAFCGFNRQDQTRVATVVSELARHASAHQGLVQFSVTTEPGEQAMVILVESSSTTVPEVDGVGLFIEQYEVLAERERTRVLFRKAFASNAPHLDAFALQHAVLRLDALPANVALSDATTQNRALNDALLALESKQAELLAVSRNLEETNKTVATLNRLLHEKAESLILADRRKDEFLALLSHELRSPLSATSMAAQMLQQHSSDLAQPAKLGELIARQASHMSRLVEELLDVSRIRMGLITVEKKLLDMRDVVKIAIEQITPALHRKKHGIEVFVPQNPCFVNGDQTRLTQVIGNLLANSIRYTPDGGEITVHVRAHETTLSVEVRDNGTGISSALLPHLFDMYVQAERSSSRRNGGLGLGLALVKSLVEIHHGTVSAASDGEGRGSAFTIVLPLLTHNSTAH